VPTKFTFDFTSYIRNVGNSNSHPHYLTQNRSRDWIHH